MMSVTELQKRLSDRKVTVLSRRTGLSLPTIYKILNEGDDANVTTKTIKILSAYFEAN